MNAMTLEGQWDKVKGRVKAKWAKLTDNELDYVAGRVEELKGILKKRYGYEKDRADKEVDTFLNSLN